ncbi:MAG: GFA family protein [Acaryochloris sp. RU_4_1]|nr:GFA family protein [Acaryochloris sp. RU_4_1]NJN37687.1 GFA family protein [Acaryochloridaceae cyanobacterium CSU_3_4]NJR55549.1 GFA family protein [Acaryochloris sp. CRU_2_0]
MKYSGSCHCGRVKFEVEAPSHLEVEECNCSICSKSGFLHLIVPQSKFSLLQGQDTLTCYQFNTGVAQHTFCRICGIKPFYIPRSNPDGYDVNVRCLDNQPDSITVIPFDGIHWEQNAHNLALKSQEDYAEEQLL